MNKKVSALVLSRNEVFLKETVDDLFNKATGDFEVIVVLDEKDQYLKPRKNLIVHKKKGKPGLRSAINQAIDVASGKYVIKTDAHCMFGEGFDEILKAECEDNWVVIPRRYSLLPEEWKRNFSRPIIDYEYFPFPYRVLTSVRSGGKWYERATDRKELMLDETMAMQGSCWFTTKKHMKNIGGYKVDTSTGDEFVLESEELANKTWLSGGKCMMNKRTWYAHLHKGSRGRGYFLSSAAMKRQRVFHIDYWMHDRWPKATRTMEWFVSQFWPIPGWDEDWQDPKYEKNFIKENNL